MRKRNEKAFCLETNLLRSYKADTRQAAIETLTKLLGYLQDDEAELRGMTDGALAKREHMSDAEYAALNVYPDDSLTCNIVAHYFSVYTAVSTNRCKMAATSARVAVSFGAKLPFSRPVMIPAP